MNYWNLFLAQILIGHFPCATNVHCEGRFPLFTQSFHFIWGENYKHLNKLKAKLNIFGKYYEEITMVRQQLELHGWFFT